MAVRTPETPQAALVADSFFFPLGVALAWACWQNSRVERIDRRTRLAWRLLAASSLALWVSGTLWVQLPRFNIQPPGWIEGLELRTHNSGGSVDLGSSALRRREHITVVRDVGCHGASRVA
jgi:hypothetical protein